MIWGGQFKETFIGRSSKDAPSTPIGDLRQKHWFDLTPYFVRKSSQQRYMFANDYESSGLL